MTKVLKAKLPKKRKPMSGQKYVLFGCPIDKSVRYDVEGFIGQLPNGDIGLIDRDKAFVYVDDKAAGAGNPEDWVKVFKKDYGLNVHPLFIPTPKK